MSCQVHPRATGGEIKTIGLFPRDGETDDECYARWATERRGLKCSCIGAPTPAQIAARAYDVAIEQAVSALDSYPIDIPGVNLGALVRKFMGERKSETLAALRESIVNPAVLPWWRKP